MIRTPPIHDWPALDEARRSALLQRPAPPGSDLEARVAEIITTVRRDGDAALREFTARYDGVQLTGLAIDPALLDEAMSRVEPRLISALQSARGRIAAFHHADAPEPLRVVTTPGLVCEARYRPISPVGLYVPGGSAPLVSTVLMLAVPALLAGCERIVLCTPPGPDGELQPALLAAIALCGLREVYRVGGAQAIAAMAYGTQTIPACAKIFGPGNAWVTEAKRQVAADPSGAAQDLPAGPSEVLVIADSTAAAEAVCWDLLAQAEHGPDSQVLLLSDSQQLLAAVATRLPAMAAGLPRAAILEQSLRNLRLLRTATLIEAVAISNRYAPEHLILNCAAAERLLDAVETAGAVFLGPWSPESLGDYSAGTNHVLPTYGHARAHSGLSVRDFMRRMSVLCANREGLASAGADAIAMAEVEGLHAHGRAVSWRLEQGS